MQFVCQVSVVWYVVIVNTVTESHADKVFSASFSIPLLEASPSLSLQLGNSKYVGLCMELVFLGTYQSKEALDE